MQRDTAATQSKGNRMNQFVREFWSKLQYLRLVRFFDHMNQFMNSWKKLK